MRPIFARRRDTGAFAFWWEAHGLSYGVPASVLDHVAAGATVIFNGSRAALPAIRAAHPDLQVIVITAPPEVLATRLAERGTGGRGRHAGPPGTRGLATASRVQRSF